MADLYRHFDKDGRLLYVGISLSAVHRLIQHKSTSHWFDEISKITIEKVDKFKIREVEKKAIEKEKPLYNILFQSGDLIRNKITGETITQTQLAKKLGVTRQTIYNLNIKKKLPVQPIEGFKPLRFRLKEVNAYLNSNVEGE